MKNQTREQKLETLLREIVDNEDVIIYDSAIERQGYAVDFENWEKRVRAALTPEGSPPTGE